MFYLKQVLHGHTQGVRCVCFVAEGQYLISGGFDGQVIIWKLNSEKLRQIELPLEGALFEIDQLGISTASEAQERQLPKVEFDNDPDETGVYVRKVALKPHSSIVLAICGSFQEQKEELPYFYSAGNDNCAHKLSIAGYRLLTFTGHAGPVCAVGEISGKQLITGSWDGTARIWDAMTAECKYILSGHSFAVCFCMLPNGTLLSGSQDKKLNFWSGPSKLKTIEDAHSDIIRSIDFIEDGFITVSNDETIKYWLLDGIPVRSHHAHDAYIYSVCVSRVIAGYVYTASEDWRLKVWKLEDGSMFQSILHCSTVWQVVELPNGDIISCCDDGMLRIWTQNEEEALPVSDRQEELNKAEESLLKNRSSAMENCDINSLRDISEVQTIRGKEGQVQMFKEGNKGIAFRYVKGTWERIGEVIGTKREKVEYAGDQFFPAGGYDHVFDVEIDSTGARKLLPCNDNDNLLVTSENFCAREGLSKDNIGQIISFLKQHTRSTSNEPHTSGKTNSNSNGKTLTSSSQVTSSSTASRNHFPAQSMIKFDRNNWIAVHKRVLEINTELPNDDEAKMDANETNWFEDFFKKLKKADFVKQEFRPVELELIFNKLGLYSFDNALPVMDIWRAMALHPAIGAFFKGTEQGWQYLSIALKNLASNQDGSLGLCSLRFIANLFTLNTTKQALLHWQDQILNATKAAVSSSNKNIRTVYSSILMNYAVAYQQRASVKGKPELLEAITKAIENETSQEGFYREIVAIGTLCYNDPQCIELCKTQKTYALISSARAAGQFNEDRVRDALKGLKCSFFVDQ